MRKNLTKRLKKIQFAARANTSAENGNESHGNKWIQAGIKSLFLDCDKEESGERKIYGQSSGHLAASAAIGC